MAQLPTRSLRLRSYTTTDLDRLTGEKGEIFYDYEKRTLKVYNGAGVAASTVKVGEITVDRLVNGSRSVVLGTNGALTISGDIRSDSNINIEINLADSTLQRWSFGEDGGLTFPDGTSQTTAWLGAGTPVYTSLIDSLDSSAITVTPTVIFSSDVTVDNELTVGTGIIRNSEATWRLNGISLELPEYGLINSRTAVTIQAYDVDQSGGAANGSGSGFYAEVFAMVYSYDDVIIRANNNGTTKDWDFQADGRLVFPVAAVPARSFGVVGDRRGMLALDATYIYYCTANYVNNSTNIWKRTAWADTSW